MPNPKPTRAPRAPDPRSPEPGPGVEADEFEKMMKHAGYFIIFLENPQVL